MMTIEEQAANIRKAHTAFIDEIRKLKHVASARVTLIEDCGDQSKLVVDVTSATLEIKVLL